MSTGSGNKTEPPTQKRLRDARKKGQVAKSKEVVSASLIIFLLTYLWLSSDYYIEKFREMIALPVTTYGIDFDAALGEIMVETFKFAATMVLPVVGIALIVGIAANFFQVGALFAPEVIKEAPKKLNPAKALKNIFSRKSLIELIKSVVKIIFLGYLIYLAVRHDIGDLLAIPRCGLGCLLPIFGSLMGKIITYAIIAFIIVAVADYFFQKFDYIKNLKMTKDEVKREFKEMEGSPEIKGHRRQLFQEIINSQVSDNVSRSSVIITNPTRMAIGIYYDEEETPLPVVTLKEQGAMAKRVIEIAREKGIPVMENVPLAHALMDQADINQYIPSDLIKPIAEVLRVIKEL